MKITITIEATVDGTAPSLSDVNRVVTEAIPGVYLSETIGQPDKWALIVESSEVEVVS